MWARLWRCHGPIQRPLSPAARRPAAPKVAGTPALSAQAIRVDLGSRSRDASALESLILTEMEPLRKFREITERIEYLRTHLGLNKSKFSAEIGMKPQTYNNFIGTQGSKPNVELLYGVVTRFGVNPLWIFTGAGSMFLDQQGEGPSAQGAAGAPAPLQVAEAGQELPAQAMQGELAALEPAVRKVEMQIRRLESQQRPVLERVAALMRRYVELHPAEAVEELQQFLSRMEDRIADR